MATQYDIEAPAAPRPPLRALPKTYYGMTPDTVACNPALSHGAVRLYAIMACYWWNVLGGFLCSLSDEQLMEKMGCSVAALRRYRTELLDGKHIVAVPRPGGWGQAKAYRPTAVVSTETDTNRSPASGYPESEETPNRSPAITQPLTGERFNRSPASALKEKPESKRVTALSLAERTTPDAPVPAPVLALASQAASATTVEMFSGEVEVIPPAASGDVQPQAPARRVRKSSAAPRVPNRNGRVIELLKASGYYPKTFSERDHQAIRVTTATPEEIVACYVAIRTGQYGTPDMVRKLTVQNAVNWWLEGYLATQELAAKNPGSKLTETSPRQAGRGKFMGGEQPRAWSGKRGSEPTPEWKDDSLKPSVY